MQIAIVGCGPAGLSAAIALHDSGFDVTLLEQFDEPGPVGSGLMLQPTGLAVLEAIGLRDQVESVGQRIDGMTGRLAGSGKVVLDIKYKVLSEGLYGVAIHRASLFQILFEAVESRHIPVLTNSRVESFKQIGNRVALGGVDKHYDFVVDASGSNSMLVKSAFPSLDKHKLSFGALWATVPLAGFSNNILEQRYVAASQMIGILPCGVLPGSSQKVATFFYSIQGNDYTRWKSEGIDLWKNEVIKLWPGLASVLDYIESAEQLTFACYSHHTLKNPVQDRMVFIGDAAHATSPQLGQGANMALLDTMALASSLMTYRDTLDQACRYYAALRRRHVRLYQSASHLLTPFYQSTSTLLPLIRDISFAPVNAIGFTDRFITRLGAGMLADPSTNLTSLYSQLLAKAR